MSFMGNMAGNKALSAHSKGDYRTALKLYEEAYAKHKEMGCIIYENPGMGIYFIADPDNYWLEIVPRKK